MGNWINNDEEKSKSKSKQTICPIYVGLILDVSNDILHQLIKFDKEKQFLENFFSEFDGEIITLINGNEETPYYNFNELLISAINYLSDKNNSIFYKSNFFGAKKNLFDIDCLRQIIKGINKNWYSFNFGYAKEVHKNILKLKDILSKYYSSFNPAFFENFKFISKPSSIDLPIESIIRVFENRNKNNFDNNYIIIISDGDIKKNSKNIDYLKFEAQKKNITIVTLLLSENSGKKKFYCEFPKNLDKKTQNLFDISSNVNYKNPFAHYYIKNNCEFPKDGQATLLLKTNLDELNNSNFPAHDMNQIRYEGINIKIEDLNYDNFSFKYKFLTKNQIFGTCWANAYSAAIFLTNKRIFGRETKTFENYRENLIKFASDEKTDGGIIENDKVYKFFKDQKINFEKVDELEAREAVMKGRFVICCFKLKYNQWNNFYNFYKNNPTGILKKRTINNGCQGDKSYPEGHAVLLTEINQRYLKFLNSWGQNWADGGTFKIENADVLTEYNTHNKPIFYDVFFYEEELTEEEKDYYANNIEFIHEIFSRYDNEMSIEIIKNRMNLLYNSLFTCNSCGKSMKLDKLEISREHGLYKILCKFCNCSNQAEGDLRELFILENLMYDGNEKFDINYEEKYYIKINRVKLHEQFKNIIENESDLCSIGSENQYEKKIDSPFINKVNNIICLDNNNFAACGENMILVFELIDTRINYLITRNIQNEYLLTLCDLKCNNLIASGGEDLKIFQINYETNELNMKYRFVRNKNITKIILINERNQDIIGKIVVSDIYGYIHFYSIQNNNSSINILYSFNKNYQESCINNMLYIENEKILVINYQHLLEFWKYRENDLQSLKKFKIISSISNNNLLDINGNLLVGEQKGITIIHHENGEITNKYFYEDNGFGSVYSINNLGNDYFICGRSFGFCSIFLLKDNNIRKINIFRNNNLSVYDENNKYEKDNYLITDICIKETSDKKYILISSVDKTLKVYEYSFGSFNLSND